MFLRIILAGAVGTAVMTFGMYLLAYMTKGRYKVVKILGTMLTFQTTPDKGLSDKHSAIWVGLTAHYLVGIGFSFCYAWLWQKDVIEINFIQITLLGLVNGVVAAIVWRIFIAIHPDPPDLPLPRYLTAIALGHILFAHGIFATHLIASN